MRALVATGRGGTELREVDEPVPAPDQAVVAVRAVSLNRVEVRGLRSADEGWRTGWDVAGVVQAPAADGSGPEQGTPVVGLSAGSGWAERAAVPTRHMATIPDGLGFAAAATLPVAGLTAVRALYMGGLLPDRRVLVTGASGGVGHFAVQLAAHDGAEVTAVVGRPERGADLERLGAARVEVGMPDGEEFDVILESVGGASLGAALAMVAPHGAIVSFGNSSGEATTFDASTFFPRSGARLCAFSLFVELERIGTGALELAHLADLAASGRLDPSIGLEVSWREADRAVNDLMDRHLVGKAVLLVD